MLIIGLVLGGFWKSLPPTEFLDWFSAHSDSIARAIPLFVVPALVGLIGGAVCDRRSPQQKYWLVALASMAGILVVTFAIHLPMNAEFNAKSIPLAEVGPMLDRWLWFHAIRIAPGLTASVFSVLAIHTRAERASTIPGNILAV
jgi:hypothetical protein